MFFTKRKILIVDDEEDFALFLKRKLERRNYKVFTAYNGQDGIRLGKAHKPDLVLLDITMPGIDGFEVLRRLKEDPKTMTVPVIMLTGKDDDDSKIKAAGLYNEDYIVKPVDVTDLQARIEKVLSRRV